MLKLKWVVRYLFIVCLASSKVALTKPQSTYLFLNYTAQLNGSAHAPPGDTVTRFDDAYPAQKQYYSKQIKKLNFDKQHWKELIKDVSYDEKVPEKPDTKKRNFSFPNISFNLSIAAQVLLIIIIVGIIAFVLYKLIGSTIFISNKSVKNQLYFELDEEKSLTDYNFEAELDKALQKKDYRLVLRIYYLIVIKQLWLQKHINWKIDKTNNDYLREMAGKAQYTLFAEVTRLFEYCWYGNQPVTEFNADVLISKFKALLQQLETENELVK